jgi:hypothetical protein
MVDIYLRGKDIRVIVWGIIWVGERLDLFIINKNEVSKKKRILREVVSRSL